MRAAIRRGGTCSAGVSTAGSTIHGVRLTIVANANRLPANRAIIPASGIIMSANWFRAHMPHEFHTVELVLPTRVIA